MRVRSGSASPHKGSVNYFYGMHTKTRGVGVMHEQDSTRVIHVCGNRKSFLVCPSKAIGSGVQPRFWANHLAIECAAVHCTKGHAVSQ